MQHSSDTPIPALDAELSVRIEPGKLYVAVRGAGTMAPIGFVDVPGQRVGLSLRGITPAAHRIVLKALVDVLESLSIARDGDGHSIETAPGQVKPSELAPLAMPLARAARKQLNG